MVYRKDEMSKGAIDRGWAHQVALPSSQVVRQFSEIMASYSKLSACVRGHWFRRNDVDFVVKCFVEEAQAAKFAAQFGGEYMTPKTRPRRLGTSAA